MGDATPEPRRLLNPDGEMSSQPRHPLRNIGDTSSDARDTTWATPRLNPDACHSTSMKGIKGSTVIGEPYPSVKGYKTTAKPHPSVKGDITTGEPPPGGHGNLGGTGEPHPGVKGDKTTGEPPPGGHGSPGGTEKPEEDTWSQYEGMEYKIFNSDEEVDWFKARELCKSKGADLAYGMDDDYAILELLQADEYYGKPFPVVLRPAKAAPRVRG
ncbi:unnamed protein product [Heligmosomoides polygyrus]|uniref:C-type lectin domain-containing protein n=1 Tax=Heligmosomoides polygyrus TaxID=6339 RepID=A0A3P7YZB6_HELPZ|nr:unnamed protein product [Heligmosomoides polygyrus]